MIISDKSNSPGMFLEILPDRYWAEMSRDDVFYVEM